MQILRKKEAHVFEKVCLLGSLAYLYVYFHIAVFDPADFTEEKIKAKGEGCREYKVHKNNK